MVNVIHWIRRNVQPGLRHNSIPLTRPFKLLCSMSQESSAFFSWGWHLFDVLSRIVFSFQSSHTSTHFSDHGTELLVVHKERERVLLRRTGFGK